MLLWLHAIGITLFVGLRTREIGHALLDGGVVALAAFLASIETAPRRLRSVTACLGLLTASAALVHLSGGYIELHFHFFVMVGVIALYQDWKTFLIAVGYVVLHHGVAGVLAPTDVYNHPDAWAHPWKWAAIHGLFILGTSVVSLVAWRVNDVASADAARRLKNTEALLAVSQTVASTLDLTETMRRVARETARALAADMVGAYLADTEGAALQPVAGYHVPPELREAFQQCAIPIRNHRFVEEAFERQTSLWSNAADIDARIDQVIRSRFPYRTVLLVPMLESGRPIGALFAVWWTARREFVPETLHLVDGISRQTAVAVANLRLYGEMERRRFQAEALSRVARELTESLDPSTIGERIADAVTSLLGVPICALRLLDQDGALVSVRPINPDGTHFASGETLPAGTGVAGRAVIEGQPVWVRDIVNDPGLIYTDMQRGRLEAAGIRSVLAVPLQAKGKLIGALALGDRVPRSFSEADVTLMQTLADHTALAIENARLYEETARGRQEAQSLADLGRLLSHSLDPDVVVRRIADNLRHLLRVKSAAVYRPDPETGALAVLAMASAGESRFRWTEYLPEGMGITGLAARERVAVASVDVLADARIRFTSEVRARIEKSDDRSGLAVPLLVQDRVIGVLAVSDRTGRAFDDKQIALARAFADQAAVALENARLYQKTQQAYLELSQTQGMLAQAQKMEAVGRLAGGVAHDFNNLITVILGRTVLVLAGLRHDDPARRSVDLIQSTARRAAGLTKQLLAFSRKQVLQPKVLDLNTAVRDMVPMLRRLIGEHIDLVVVEEPRAHPVLADPGQLEQVIMNLSVNARDAMPQGGRLTVSIATADVPAGDGDLAAGEYAVLVVGDTGTGMTEETRAHLFEPFFTTKEQGKGTGLGLATVYGIVRQSGGHVTVETALGQGTTFRVYLPRTATGASPPEPTSTAAETGGAETILLVEDEDAVRDLTREVLERGGYRLLAARRPGDALALAERYEGVIHLVLTDVVMPEMSGRRLAERLLAQRPDLRVLYMSGYTDDAIAQHGVLEPGMVLLEKPFVPDTLLRRIRDVLDTPTR